MLRSLIRGLTAALCRTPILPAEPTEGGGGGGDPGPGGVGSPIGLLLLLTKAS